MEMTKNEEFADKWKNQTDIGKRFGLSSVAVGKILASMGLKDDRNATQKALDEGYAKFTPLKDGTPFYMWNATKISDLIGVDHQRLTNVEYWVNEILTKRKEINRLWSSESGADQKLATLLMDVEYDDVPKNIREEVKKIVEAVNG